MKCRNKKRHSLVNMMGARQSERETSPEQEAGAELLSKDKKGWFFIIYWILDFGHWCNEKLCQVFDSFKICKVNFNFASAFVIC